MVVLDRPGDEWDALVARLPEATVAHLAAWAHVLRGAYGYEPRYLVLKRGAAVKAGLPLMLSRGLSGRRLRGLPMIHGAGPLPATDSDRRKLLADAVEAGEQAGAAVVGRTTLPPKWVVELGSVPPLELADWKKPSLHLVRSLRESEEAGIAVDVSAAAADLRTFYRRPARGRARSSSSPPPTRICAPSTASTSP